MANPIFNALGGSMQGPIGNMQQMIQSFTQFKNTFKGDPKQTVMNMINSGQISQEQLNKAQQMARQFQQIIPR